MKLSCGQWCKVQEMLANLKCPSCFSAKVKLCKDEADKNAKCETCECEFEYKPDVAERWE